MVRSEDGTTITARGNTTIEKYIISTREPADHLISKHECKFWGEPCTPYSGRPHVTANKRKKAKRKQAQTSRRKNRRL